MLPTSLAPAILAFALLVSGCSTPAPEPRSHSTEQVGSGSRLRPAVEPRIDPSIDHVVTAHRDERILRVVVENVGFEHIYGRAYLQWLESDREGETRILASRIVEEVGFAVSLGPPVIEPLETGFRVHLDGTHTHSFTDRTLVLIVGEPGTYRVESESGP